MCLGRSNGLLLLLLYADAFNAHFEMQDLYGCQPFDAGYLEREIIANQPRLLAQREFVFPHSNALLLLPPSLDLQCF